MKMYAEKKQSLTKKLTEDVCSCSSLVVNYVTLAIGEVLLLILTVCSLAAIFPRVRKQN